LTLQVAHQRKMFVEYERRERRRKVRHSTVSAALALAHRLQSPTLAASAGLMVSCRLAIYMLPWVHSTDVLPHCAIR